MGKVHNVEPLTENPFVNLYLLSTEKKTGRLGKYYVASRAKSVSELKLKTRRVNPDGVIIYGIHGENHDQVVLVKQYRFSIDDYIYEFPAGLVDEGESFQEAGIREFKEETGMVLVPVSVGEGYEKPYFTTVGLTDEACGTVFGYACGEPDTAGLEESEEIEVVLADRAEAARILKEEKVAIMCAYMLMHFIHDEEPFGFLR